MELEEVVQAAEEAMLATVEELTTEYPEFNFYFTLDVSPKKRVRKRVTNAPRRGPRKQAK